MKRNFLGWLAALLAGAAAGFGWGAYRALQPAPLGPETLVPVVMGGATPEPLAQVLGRVFPRLTAAAEAVPRPRFVVVEPSPTPAPEAPAPLPPELPAIGDPPGPIIPRQPGVAARRHLRQGAVQTLPAPAPPAPGTAPTAAPPPPKFSPPAPPATASEPEPSPTAEPPAMSVPAPVAAEVPSGSGPKVAVSGPAAVDAALQSLPLGSMSYHLPEPMQAERSHAVKLLISPSETVAALKGKLEGSGQTGGQQIRVSGFMEPRLNGAGFEITPEFTAGPVAISSSEPTSWVWSVRPKEAGPQRLRLIIDAILEVEGKEGRRTVEVFDREIVVAVQPRAWASPLFWAALGAASVATLAGGGWWWQRRPRRRSDHGSLSGAPGVLTGNGEVFISYSRKDLAAVLPLVERLRREGFGVWMDVAGIDGATQWREEIARALDQARAVVLLASRNSFASEFVTRELLLAAEERKPLVPVFLEPAEVPATLRLQLAGVQRIEYQAGDEEGFAQVHRALARLGLGKAS